MSADKCSLVGRSKAGETWLADELASEGEEGVSLLEVLSQLPSVCLIQDLDSKEAAAKTVPRLRHFLTNAQRETILHLKVPHSFP